MEQEQQERAKILLQATLDILNKSEEGVYVQDVMGITAIWDDAECDGYCLKEDIRLLIEEINRRILQKNEKYNQNIIGKCMEVLRRERQVN